MLTPNPRSHSIFNSDLPRSGLLVALYRGTSLISRAVRWQTRSVYSHAALLLSSPRESKGLQGCVIEAWHQGGVALNMDLGDAHTPGTMVDLFEVDGLTALYAEDVIAFALEQVGKHYDFSSILRFVTRCQSTRKISGEWFCSELVFAALQKAGINLLERIDPCDVSPGMLALSPLLRFVESVEVTNFEGREERYERSRCATNCRQTEPAEEGLFV